MPVDIIRKAVEEHDAKNRVQVTHIGIGKTSKMTKYHPAFQRVPPSTRERHKALPLLKERGYQEVIVMVAKFQNPRKSEQAQEVVVQQSVCQQ